MDYHSDRFLDHSLLVFKKDKLISLFPANIEEGRLVSHGGLTYGGFIIDSRMTLPLFLEMFQQSIAYMKDRNISKIIYKTIPYIYHETPAEEDRYALYLYDAQLIRRDVASVIRLGNKIDFQKMRTRLIKRAAKQGLEVRMTDDMKAYWKILELNLMEHHGRRPVHTVEEIILLKNRFPKNIKLFASYDSGIMLAGVVIYESDNVIHVQYSANSEEGRKKGALDIIFDFLVNDFYEESNKYFDFGISTEQKGQFLNLGLIAQKEGFGARSVVHDFYELNLV